MKGGCLTMVLLLFYSLLLLPDAGFSLPLCTNSMPGGTSMMMRTVYGGKKRSARQRTGAPFTITTPLGFCSYNGSVCCNTTLDSQLQKQFEALKISDNSCASLLKPILCAKCDKFSAELYTVLSAPRTVPVLCNSTISATSTQYIEAITNFCSKVWNTCQNVSMFNSPFSSSSSTSANSTKLSDTWRSEADFCNAFGGASLTDSVCFAGDAVTLDDTETLTPPSGLCFEKIGNGSYLNMVPHPDGSNRAFFSNQAGKIWLATIPEVGSGGILGLVESSPFLDLTDEVLYNTEFGMLGLAFHPNFVQNGRFFVSFNCDKAKWPGCAGRCACNSDIGCDPSKLGTDQGAQPCQYQSVVSEYTTNGTTSPSLATSAKPSEVSRIFTMGLPYTTHHAGQLLFGPTDGYLYFMMGDGGSTDDPNNFSQNKKSLLGKIMRLDIDKVPSGAEVSNLSLWGNYSIPLDNPYTEDSAFQPEIWALGLRNPWRCSFDSAKPSYFICGDVGKDRYEEVDLITKGGNYGWRTYEGPYLYKPPANNASLNSTNFIFPVMGYLHSEVNSAEGSASITGGYVYRSTTDPCLYGRYVYADLYAGAIWAGIEDPEDSGSYNSSQIPFSCAKNSPISCSLLPGSSLPALGYIFSFGEDNNKDVFILASSGVYRCVAPSNCNYACSKESTTASSSPGPSSTGHSFAIRIGAPNGYVVLLFSSILLILLQYF